MTEMKLFAVILFCAALFCAIASSSDVQCSSSSDVQCCTPCPSGWARFNGYCYLVRSYTKTWSQAQAYCKAKGGELVKINSADENEFVLALVRKHASSRERAWIGLKWDSTNNQFMWSDFSVPQYKNWAPNEPNGKAKEPCGHMWTRQTRDAKNRASGFWNDSPCGVLSYLPSGLVCKMLP